MTPRHHPSQDLIASCAAGTLRPGAALVVRAHIARCPTCRAEAGFFESLGGALLETETPAPMSAGALDRALAAIDRPAPAPPAPARVRSGRPALPHGLDGVTMGKRRWIAPGVTVTPVTTRHNSRELVYLLRIGAGMVLPRHTHAGCEFTCVLEGSFSDSAGRYDPGDFIATDESIEHSPVVARDGPCVCLAATDSPLVMRDLVGRIFQPLAGI
ncbi:ChrR family anti-sigma-E factor [Phenylobacterium sp. J367]|uniref:ChrR family anti-sigma-E factor n=1 Tax=Phenylobacterium sp. J367 TaxID=2898435 RepID=UPI00215195D2|nr:ChrR family anti-sigma-E factor [Phenylobacterium sp. J367]MCR5878906.1 ChrR family anti-sigma-E factor [Phenylobacterium sp. J367]